MFSSSSFPQKKETYFLQVLWDGLERLNKEGPAVPFTLPPEAVLEKVVRALEARTPKARYYVTFPTGLFAWLKRLLPARTLDRLLRKAGK